MAASGRSLAAGRRLYTLQTVYSSAVGVLIALGTAAVVWVGARHVMDGSLTLGSLVVFVSYLASLYGPLYSMFHTWGARPGIAGRGRARLRGARRRARGARRAPRVPCRGRAGRGRVGGRLLRLRAGPPRARRGEPRRPPGLEGRGRRPDGRGQVDAPEPPAALLRPDGGRVLIDGVDVRDYRLARAAAADRDGAPAAARLPGEPPREHRVRPARRAARRDRGGGARWRRSTRPSRRCRQGYDTLVGEQGATLSEGEKQRITIARALLRDSPILILDEPTSSLDGETEALIMQGLERLTAGRTTFIIAHRLSTIRKADLIVVLRDGADRRAGDLRDAHGGRWRLRLAVPRPGLAPGGGGPGRPVATERGMKVLVTGGRDSSAHPSSTGALPRGAWRSRRRTTDDGRARARASAGEAVE